MNVIEISSQAAAELAETLQRIDQHQVETLLTHIKSAHRIFVAGAGRSLLMLKAFAMRLMHVGLDAYVVGDVTTPAFLKNDLLVVASASGETANLLSIAGKAKKYGGSVIGITIFENSSLAKTADTIVRIPAYTDKLPQNINNKRGILNGSSTFEEAVLLLGDSMIVKLADYYKIDADSSFKNHANLE